MRFVLMSATDAIALKGGGAGDEIGWTLTGGVEGWFGSPDIREEPVKLTMEDGDYFPSTLSQGARPITLSVFIKGKSSLDLEVQLDRLNAMMGQKITVIGESAIGCRQCEGFIAEDPAPIINAYGQTASCDIIITCPDPYKYSPIKYRYQIQPTVHIENPGNVEMYPFYSIYSASGFINEISISCAGKTLVWRGAAYEAHIDTKNMTCSSGYFSSPTLVPIKLGGDDVTISADKAFDGEIITRPAWR